MKTLLAWLLSFALLGSGLWLGHCALSPTCSGSHFVLLIAAALFLISMSIAPLMFKYPWLGKLF